MYTKDKSEYNPGKILGFLSPAIESQVAVPQLYMNWKRKNCGGLSIVLILNWIVGNVFKISYYLKNNAPMTLVFALVYTQIVDIIILFQFWLYSKPAKVEDQSKKKDWNKRYADSLTRVKNI